MPRHRRFDYRSWHLNRSARAEALARWFRLDPDAPDPHHCNPRRPALVRTLRPAPGEITLITGPSGAGKSSLLRAVCAAHQDIHWVALGRVAPSARPLVDCFGTAIALPDVLALLNEVGLGEIWTFLRTPDELSDGQRWRLHLAMSLLEARQSAKPATLIIDEFAALLDRITAAVVARALRRAIKDNLSALVATSHEDLVEALAPEVIVHCDFGCDSMRRKEGKMQNEE